MWILMYIYQSIGYRVIKLESCSIQQNKDTFHNIMGWNRRAYKGGILGSMGLMEIEGIVLGQEYKTERVIMSLCRPKEDRAYYISYKTIYNL
jgi:hypothetical protein